MMRFPALHLSVVVLFNHFLWDMQDYALRVADLFVENREVTGTAGEERAAPPAGAAAVELSAEQLEAKAGVYYSARRAALREVRTSGGRPQLQGYDLSIETKSLGEARLP